MLLSGEKLAKILLGRLRGRKKGSEKVRNDLDSKIV
jgi:hypothetical protein